MGIKFVAASSQFLRETSTVLTTLPFTVGCWVRPVGIGVAGAVWTVNHDTTNSGRYFVMFQNTDNLWYLEAVNGGASQDMTCGVPSANVWFFIVTRCIAAANRRMDVLSARGVYTTSQQTTSIAHTNVSPRMSIGCFDNGTAGNSLFYNGDVAELWYTKTDIYPAGAIPKEMLWELAYNGPFGSSLGIANQISEYRSYRKHPIGGDGADIYAGTRSGPGIWANTTSMANIGEHPPLLPTYRGPQDRTLIRTI